MASPLLFQVGLRLCKGASILSVRESSRMEKKNSRHLGTCYLAGSCLPDVDQRTWDCMSTAFFVGLRLGECRECLVRSVGPARPIPVAAMTSVFQYTSTYRGPAARPRCIETGSVPDTPPGRAGGRTCTFRPNGPALHPRHTCSRYTWEVREGSSHPQGGPGKQR